VVPRLLANAGVLLRPLSSLRVMACTSPFRRVMIWAGKLPRC
jgi:hypothetical protein